MSLFRNGSGVLFVLILFVSGFSAIDEAATELRSAFSSRPID